jgi:nucleotidyltransferase/DNA polymerase involved in DNA repair
VIAASVEAKRMGMKVGMTMEEAKAICPSAVFVENDPSKYRAVTSRVFSILHGLTDQVEHYSIDEAFLDLTGWYRDAAEAAWALTRARMRIRDEVGEWLRCSIGIAPTRFLAKTASDIEKPNGLVVIDRDNLDEILSRLDLEDVCGIGPRIRKRLERLGIRSLLDVKRYPVGNLMRAFGKYGLFLWCKLHGMEFEKVRVEDESPPKSIGHSYCVPDRVNREARVAAVFTRLVERAARRMRQQGLLAGTVSVAVGFRFGPVGEPLAGARAGTGDWAGTRPAPTPMDPYGDGASDWMRLDEPASDSFTLVGVACDLLSGMWHPPQRVNFLAVTLSELSEPTGQRCLSLSNDCHCEKFDDPSRPFRAGSAISDVGRLPRAICLCARNDRKKSASSAADLIRDRYGDEAIMFGSMLRAGDHAPDRIGFRKTTGVDIAENPNDSRVLQQVMEV